MRDVFHQLAHTVAEWVGSPAAFAVAVLGLLVWAVLGPVFHFSDTWQLIVNTATTIITFLVVFLIQNTQNRDARVMHLKLDELIRSSRARNSLIDLENLSDDEIARIQTQFEQIRQERQQRADRLREERRRRAQKHRGERTGA